MALTRLMLLLLTAFACAALPTAAAAAPSVRGDFDGDGRSDLAVGAPLDSVSGQNSAGAVNVLYGSGRGLRADPDQQFTQDTPGILGAADEADRFGAALATGDFDADGYSDLAVGAPSESVSGVRRAGVVHVIYGSSGGLTRRDELFGQGFSGVPGTREPDQNFGAAVAAGDFDGDGRDDLAVGAPDDGVEGAEGAGAVNVLYSSSEGLAPGSDQQWTQNSPGIKGLAAPFHRFGAALAAGDLDDDGRDDLAIGIPGGRIDGHQSAGATSVLYGSGAGLSQQRDRLWSQGARGIKGAPEDGDLFGQALAMGDFNQDGDADLAIGVPHEGIGGNVRAGAVAVLYGGGRADELRHQGDPGIKGAPERDDRFASALAAADFDGDNEDDLAIGIPLEGVSGHADAGAVQVIYGTEGKGGLARRDNLWHRDDRGIKGVAAPFDNFGRAVGAGDFDGDGRFDLVAGAPFDARGGSEDAGSVNVIYGSRGGLGEDPDQLWSQGSRGVKGAVGTDNFGSALAPR